ncbi:hypothetical protein D9611_006394 [Ephemerocybe angulata]|uniref:Uncharacterized protein n=1 Tax=Ephemerocybe angulata TaxID=980116 RepID=A0A8H5C6G2_9AGAR|nr:hypothetical protein D9611_006394 [Tulosesus angulatus]
MPGSQGDNASFSDTPRTATGDPKTPLKKFSFSRPKRTRPVDSADENPAKRLKTTSTTDSDPADTEASAIDTPTPPARNNKATRNAKNISHFYDIYPDLTFVCVRLSLSEKYNQHPAKHAALHVEDSNA